MKVFSAGDIIGTTFRVYGAALVPLLVLSLLTTMPSILFQLYMVSSLELTQEAVARLQWMGWVGTVLSMVCQGILTGAACFTVMEQLRGRQASVGQSISVGLSRMLTVIGVSILTGLCVGIGFVLLIIPGVIAWLMLSVSIPAAVIEKTGAAESMSRSASLTGGYRGAIFVAGLGVGVIAVLPVMLVQWLMVGNPLETPADTLVSQLRNTMLAQLVLSVILGPLTSVLSTVIYNELRTVKEGVDTETLAAVFD